MATFEPKLMGTLRHTGNLFSYFSLAIKVFLEKDYLQLRSFFAVIQLLLLSHIRAFENVFNRLR